MSKIRVIPPLIKLDHLQILESSVMRISFTQSVWCWNDLTCWGAPLEDVNGLQANKSASPNQKMQYLIHIPWEYRGVPSCRVEQRWSSVVLKRIYSETMFWLIIRSSKQIGNSNFFYENYYTKWIVGNGHLSLEWENFTTELTLVLVALVPSELLIYLWPNLADHLVGEQA